MTSMCLGVQRMAYASRLSGSAVHLKACDHVVHTASVGHSLGAPALDNTCEHHLLRVIGNKRDEVINDLSEMSIWTSADNRSSHPQAQ